MIGLLDAFKYHHIACADHEIINPISSAKVDELLGVLDLPAHARVLDVACGKAEMLVRLAERGYIQATGVDLSPRFAAEAVENVRRRVRAPSKVEIVVMDGAKFSDPEPFDLAMCVGASWVFGGHRGALRSLAARVRPGGLVLVGEPYWIKSPDPGYLTAAGVKAEDFGTNAGNVEAGVDEGLLPLYSVSSSQDDWDRYEWLRVRAVERYCHRHPDDPDVVEMLARTRQTRDAHLRWARDTICWALYLFRKP